MGAAHHLVELGHAQLGELGRHAHGHDLLGEDVERVARDHRRLDLAVAHPLHDDRRLEQVGA